MFRLVVFDLDGTLINSVEAIMKSINLTFAEFGLGPYEWEKDIVRFFGKPFEIWAETLLKEGKKYSHENLEKAVNTMYRHYNKIGPAHARLYPHALEVLSALKNRGVKLAVATNMISRHMKTYFSRFDLGAYFEKMCTLSDVKRGKPYPDQLECIQRETGVPKNETLVVGDSETDLEFARNSGVKIAVLDAVWNKNLKPDYRIKDLKELLDIV